MASTADSDNSSAADPIKKLQDETEALKQEAAASLERAKQIEEANEQRHAQLQMQEQLLTPITVHNISVHGAPNTRRGFLDPIFSPLVNPSQNTNTTLGDVTESLRSISSRLDRLGIFQPSPQIALAQAEQTDPSAAASDVDIDFVVQELPRYKFNAGTDVGNSEGSAFTTLLWRNIFGGAEQLTLNASAGTRTRSAYTAELSAPMGSDPDHRVSLEALSSATEKPWGSHEEVLNGGSLRYQWLAAQNVMHSVEYSGLWRQVTGLSGGASPTVRADAGDSVKSAIKYMYRRDTRDNPQLPQNGWHFKSQSEIAGVGPLGGDVAFSKSEVETGVAMPIPLPGWGDRPTGISVGGGLRFGMLCPLAPGFSYINGDGLARPSRINDRFQLGGPTDVRGFKLGGIGPHDGADATGGDVFAAGSINMLFPLPYKGPESSLRFHVFANGGRSAALKDVREEKDRTATQGMTCAAVTRGMLGAVGELANGPPSLAAGVGLVYAHPVARFELNFSLPLVVRKDEIGTKGLQVGVGINFL